MEGSSGLEETTLQGRNRRPDLRGDFVPFYNLYRSRRL